MKDHKLVFICGLHRSGTSIFFKCMREHPLLSGFSDTGVWEDEGQHLQSVYKPAKCYGGPGKFGFSPAAHLTEKSYLVSQENVDRLMSEWGKYWDTEKPYLVEKSPPNLIMTRFLQAMFPDAYFLVILRHPVAVAYATQRFAGGKPTIYSMIKHWVACHEIFDRDSGQLKNLFVLRYEDFVRSPDEYLKNIYTFLGVEPHRSSLKVHSDINRKYFVKWQQCLDRALTRPYVYALRKIFEKRVNKFGYSLYDLNKSWP